MSKLDKIVEDLSALTVLEAAELSKLLEEKWGVSAAAPVAVAAAGGGAAAPAEAAEEQTEFTLVLTAGGDKKINVIKEVCGVRPDLGLKEAKDLVEAAPANVLETSPSKSLKTPRRSWKKPARPSPSSSLSTSRHY